MEKIYQNHQVFDQLIEYAKFYKDLSFSVFGWITQGTNAIVNIDSQVYSSLQGTLESMREILVKGRINDSYTLLRKYYDSVIINSYTILYLSDNFSFENFVVQKIENWLQGKEKLPDYRIMSNYIRSSEKLAPINDLLYKDNTYKNLRDRCNNHIHYNFYYTLLLNNDNVFYEENKKVLLDTFSKDLRNIFILHFSYVFYLNDKYMMSSNYVDSLELGLTPEENSQYYVATFIQEVFDNVIKKNRMDLAKEIKNNTSMMLE